MHIYISHGHLVRNWRLLASGACFKTGVLGLAVAPTRVFGCACSCRVLFCRPFNAEEEALFEESAQFAYRSFRDKAASSRGMSTEDMQVSQEQGLDSEGER